MPVDALESSLAIGSSKTVHLKERKPDAVANPYITGKHIYKFVYSKAIDFMSALNCVWRVLSNIRSDSDSYTHAVRNEHIQYFRPEEFSNSYWKLRVNLRT